EVNRSTQSAAVERQLRPCLLEQPGNGQGISQREGVSVSSHRRILVLQRSCPDLCCSKLRQPVLDVIEGRLEDVRDLLPANTELRLEIGVVDVGEKPSDEIGVRGGTRFGIDGLPRGEIRPVLKCVDDGDVAPAKE